MLAFGRTKLKMSDRPLMLMTLMHGDFQARQFAFYQDKGACPPQFKTQLDAQLPRLTSP